jgi:hypothetical protein
MMCEAILQVPALAKADGLIKSKEDLMAVLAKKKFLGNKEMMKNVFSFDDMFNLYVSSGPPPSKKRPRAE